MTMTQSNGYLEQCNILGTHVALVRNVFRSNQRNDVYMRGFFLLSRQIEVSMMVEKVEWIFGGLEEMVFRSSCVVSNYSSTFQFSVMPLQKAPTNIRLRFEKLQVDKLTPITFRLMALCVKP